MNHYQPYYLAFCNALGIRPDKMEKGTRANAAYMLWIQARWREFRALRPDCFHPSSGTTPGNPTDDGVTAFGEWLATWKPAFRERGAA